MRKGNDYFQIFFSKPSIFSVMHKNEIDKEIIINQIRISA